MLEIAGGVALLLWAARMVRTGVMRAYGTDLRRFLGRSTRSRLTACAMGVATAGILQSATATALVAVSFAARGLIGVGAGLAIMLGADIGSTLVVQVLSFKIAGLSPALILIGVVSFLAGPSERWRHLGRVFIGLGLMLLSLTLVVGASQPLRESVALGYVMKPLAADPILGLLLAALFTWLAHSSVAIVLLIMSLTAVGVVPLPLGFALVLGANVGSGLIPVVLSASGTPVARRIPLGNLLFRATGAVIVLPLIGLIAPHMDLLGGEAARQIANFHTLFNLAMAAAFLPFIGVMERLMVRLLPDTGAAEGEVRPRYLDSAAIERPSVAMACATREVLRVADTVETMLRNVMEALRTGDTKLLDRIRALDDEVDTLHEAIKIYLTRVNRQQLSEDESRRCVELLAFATHLERIGDVVDKDMVEVAQKKNKRRLTFSEQGWRELSELYDRVMDQMQQAVSVLVSGDVETARQLIRDKERFRALELEGEQSHLERLRSGRVESIETSTLHLDILRDLKQINSALTSIAYPILESSGELRSSRLVPDSELDQGTGGDAGKEVRMARAGGGTAGG